MCGQVPGRPLDERGEGYGQFDRMVLGVAFVKVDGWIQAFERDSRNTLTCGWMGCNYSICNGSTS